MSETCYDKQKFDLGLSQIDALQSCTMMTSPNGNIFRVSGLLCGEVTGHRWIPHTKATDAEQWCFFDLHLNQQLSKPCRRWWFETLPRSLWRHCNYLTNICWSCHVAHLAVWLTNIWLIHGPKQVSHWHGCDIVKPVWSGGSKANGIIPLQNRCHFMINEILWS